MEFLKGTGTSSEVGRSSPTPPGRKPQTKSKNFVYNRKIVIE